MSKDSAFVLFYAIYLLFFAVAGIVIFLIIRKNIRKNHADNVKRREEEIQAKRESLMRQMIQIYVKYHEKGFAPSWVKEDFKRLFDEYRKLRTSEEELEEAENFRDKFYSLPESKS